MAKALVKTEEQKYNKLTNAQIDALLTKNHDNEASRAYIENMPNQEWHISQIDGYLKMLLASSSECFSSTAKISRKLSSKINVYPHGETGVGKQNQRKK